MTDPSQLHGRWLHSHEEDTPGALVYRPADYPFPRSRGRDGLDLSAGGAATTHAIAPTDGTRAQAGGWRLEPDGTLVVQGEGGGERRYQVLSAGGGKLVLAR